MRIVCVCDLCVTHYQENGSFHFRSSPSVKVYDISLSIFFPSTHTVSLSFARSLRKNAELAHISDDADGVDFPYQGGRTRRQNRRLSTATPAASYLCLYNHVVCTVNGGGQLLASQTTNLKFGLLFSCFSIAEINQLLHTVWRNDRLWFAVDCTQLDNLRINLFRPIMTWIKVIYIFFVTVISIVSCFHFQVYHIVSLCVLRRTEQSWKYLFSCHLQLGADYIDWYLNKVQVLSAL